MNQRSAMLAAGYIATIPAANLLITHLGPVPVGLGQLAPAGVFMAGLALVLRDLLHHQAGKRVVLAAIAVGVAVSYLLADPALATASTVAFGVAELADMAVYAPLRKRGLLLAVAASNAVGLLVDSWLFLRLAFGNQEFLAGQVIAKTQMTVLAVVVLLALVRHRHNANPPEFEPCDCTLLQRDLCGHCCHDRCEDCGTCAGGGHTSHACIALGAGT